MILRAIEWRFEDDVHLINLSLGTHNASHRLAFEEWATKVTLISADGALPGGLSGVVTVSQDAALRRDEWNQTGPLAFAASGRPRPIPGGVSFAVANFTGLAANALLPTRRLPWEPVSQLTDC